MLKTLIAMALIGLVLTAGALVADSMVTTRPAPPEKARGTGSAPSLHLAGRCPSPFGGAVVNATKSG